VTLARRKRHGALYDVQDKKPWRQQNQRNVNLWQIRLL